MKSKVFDRIEKKYLISKVQKKQILKEIKKYVKEDSYFKSEVLNLYFDTDNFDLISQSIDWTSFKHKIRARSYSGYDRVFLEIKTKLRQKESNPGYKRRVMITRKDFKKLVNKQSALTRLITNMSGTKNDLQIASEIDYLINNLDLKPRILVIYHRESYKDEEGLRITFDEKLRYRNDNLSFVKKKHDKIYFKNDSNIIMEIKSQGALPLWLVKVLSSNKAYPQQFSKIGKIYERITKEANV